MCQLGGAIEGLTGRIKDFETLSIPESNKILIVTGSSDGALRIWNTDEVELINEQENSENNLKNGVNDASNGQPGSAKARLADSPRTRHVGQLLGTYEAGNRITCLKAFMMLKSSDNSNAVSDGERLEPEDEGSSAS